MSTFLKHIMLYLASDHAGFTLKDEIKNRFLKSNLEFVDLTPEFYEGDDYPDSAEILAQKIRSNNNFGLAFCGTGTGICIALNRFRQIRAVATLNEDVLKLARKHNNVNVLCLPGRLVSLEEALKMVQIFLNTSFDPNPRHIRRIEKVS